MHRFSPFLSEHPQRGALHNELHARPPQALAAPLTISHIVMMCDAAAREASRAHLSALLRDAHLPPPDPETTHMRADLGAIRLRWELHSEFVTWTFFQPLPGHGLDERHAVVAANAVRQQWLAALPGQCLGALNLWVVSNAEAASAPGLERWLHEESLVGSEVAGGRADVYTDFLLHPDGFSRLVLNEKGLSARELGRLVQQLIEIDTYRMAALLGLPVARDASAALSNAERELAALAASVRNADRNEEPALLDRLTRLAGEVESHHAATHSRLSASAAYFELVDRRLEAIDEARIGNLQTLGEFLNRRLSPARATCAWSTRRQAALSERVSRISNLLRTRVEVEQQQSTQALMAVMNKRQALQIHLQSTVEGLSVAAISYYIVGLCGYVVKGLHGTTWPASVEATVATSVPIVALAVWWHVRRLHHRVSGAL